MLNIMTKDPNFVSVRLPDDVAIWLREYATANKLVRADKPNMGGSIISIVRTAMSGQTISNNVGQSDVDIDSKIDAAIASKISEMRKEINDLKSTVNTVTKDFARYRDIEIDDLTARVVALETNRSEATAAANFTPDVAEVSLETEPLPIIEAIANIAAPSIENPLPDVTLDDAIASTAKPKSTKRSAKSKAKYTRDELEKLKNTDIRKIYRAEIPVADRALDPNYASKTDMIDAILTAKNHT